MSGYRDLRDLGVQFRPFDGTPPRSAYEQARFKARWEETCKLLARELRMLQARAISLELNITELDFRLDGLPRADARISPPSVRISFTSVWGPLQYETGEYDDWQDNVRAIALSMEALRAVDRYGVSKRGEQYRGWRALPMPGGDVEREIPDAATAREFLDSLGGLTAAIKATHPDAGGDADKFRKVMRAKELIGA